MSPNPATEGSRLKRSAIVKPNGNTRKAKWQHNDTEQKSQMAIEKIRHSARHKVAHNQAHGDGKRNEVQQAEQPTVRTDKCREGALAFAAAVFNFKVLHKAHPEIP